jgi:hypothetical protein
MKKTFPLHAPGKADPRVVEAIKHDVRKYVKRERGKTLPEGFDLWEFACKVGATGPTATITPLNDVGAAIDAIVNAGGTEVYVEILAVAGHRIPRVAAPVGAAPDAAAAGLAPDPASPLAATDDAAPQSS